MYAVQIGAGKIGRGFIGQLLFDSGYFTTFIDKQSSLVALLQSTPTYKIQFVYESSETIEIGRFDAIHSSELLQASAAIGRADLLSIAVGASNLATTVVPLLVSGIVQRCKTCAPPLNILLCENSMHGKALLHEAIVEALPASCRSYYGNNIALIDTFVGRMVPSPSEQETRGNPLWLVAEPCNVLFYDADAVIGDKPQLKHATPKHHFDAILKEKLYIHMMGHSATAYLGHLRQQQYIWQAIRDPLIRETVEASTTESCRGIMNRYGVDPSELATRRADFILRYHNRILNDSITRVALDPIRKLSPHERFCGAARLCLEENESAAMIALAATAAIHYFNPEDLESCAIQKILNENSIKGVLQQICCIPEGDPFYKLMLEANERLLDTFAEREILVN